VLHVHTNSYIYHTPLLLYTELTWRGWYGWRRRI